MSVPSNPLGKTLYLGYRNLPFFTRTARRERRRERDGTAIVVRDNRFHVREAVDWLIRAQESSPDRGVARGYSLTWSQHFDARGWQPSYPETTGYIIPTFFDCARYLNDADLGRRALEMAHWEMAVQLPSGAVMGGTVDRRPPTPAVFNTGQVILGWLRAHRESGEKAFLEAARRAGAFLVAN
ncbi:MAG: hypothetical protein HQM02_12530, partial [Magnetococcales bacterium]|nr:hypothetical protein [Magnetococcales bacterium]